ncbi:hypothetical protein CMI47_09970 [Candidatus Pacearchaeota archaeon]|jgi:hypothetical protein|nr:hypothetical protein [Candidatus Pacearchaeota archaeon]|tara:strand:- start:6219 stop:6527 length:309 start_codon:yes stop_codon:yes gene_type:complete
MKLIWKEVSPYSGREIEEDAPVNSVAGGGVDMSPGVLYQKKKKQRELMTREGQRIDGRTKSYREHRKKLESARARRQEALASKKSGFAEQILKSMKKHKTSC